MATQVRTMQLQGQPTDIAIFDELATVLDEVASAQRGRFAYVEGHVSGLGDSACERAAVSDKWFIGNPRYDKYLVRKSTAIMGVTSEADVAAAVGEADWGRLARKLAAENVTAAAKGKPVMTTAQLFAKAKAELLTSIVKTQAGDRSDGFRQGHDACYAYFKGGDVEAKVHLYTEPDAEGHKRPVPGVLGLYEADSVMLPYFLLNRRTIDPGQWREVDSKALTLMKRAIEDASGVPVWTNLSLGKGNFRSVSLNSAVIQPKVQDMRQAVAEAQFAEFLRDICRLTMDVLDVLDTEAAHTVVAVTVR